MAMLPALHPKLPFVGQIPGNGLYHGSMIRIQGIVGTMSMWPRGSEKFTINLQYEPNINPLGDVPLHVDMRLREQVVVRNHHIRNTGWGQEERFGSFPLNPGQEYEILILSMNNCYKIAINGKHFCEFNHRLPMSRIRYVYITGDTTINSVRMDWDSSQPQSNQIPSAPPISVTSVAFVDHNPIHRAPNYAHPPGYNSSGYNRPGYNPPNYNSPGTIHQPILTSPPYNPHGSSPYAQQSGYGSYPSGEYPYGGGGPGGPVMMNKEYVPTGGVPVMLNKEYLPPTGYPYGSGGGGGGSPVTMNKQYLPESGSKSKKYLKYAAIAGGVGLGAYVLSQALADSSDSD